MTESERERLAMLSEECGEVVQIIGKILRHGYKSYHPDDPDKTPNSLHLEREIEDVLVVVNMMIRAGDIRSTLVHKNYNEARARKMKYTYHQTKG